VEVDIANDGKMEGEETAFLFIRDPVASVARPVLELKGTQKITLAPGQTGTLRFTLTCDDVSFPGEDGRPILESGAIEVLVGPKAERVSLLKAVLEVRV
jgi:beta-glucosidase